jgi:hypothetical protein
MSPDDATVTTNGSRILPIRAIRVRAAGWEVVERERIRAEGLHLQSPLRPTPRRGSGMDGGRPGNAVREGGAGRRGKKAKEVGERRISKEGEKAMGCGREEAESGYVLWRVSYFRDARSMGLNETVIRYRVGRINNIVLLP